MDGPKAQDKTRQNTEGPKPKTQRRKDSKNKQKWATRIGQSLKKLMLKKNSKVFFFFLKIFILKETLFLKTQFYFFYL